MDSLKVDAVWGQEPIRELCRSLALVAGSTSVSFISLAGSPSCAYPIDMVVENDLASWVRRLEACQPMLWQGHPALMALPAGVIPHPEPAALALLPVLDGLESQSALLLCWNETPIHTLTSEWLASLVPFVEAYCERARLKRVLQQREERWRALYETTVALTHELGSTELLQSILQRCMQLLDLEGGGILLIDPGSDELVMHVASSTKLRVADLIGWRIKRGEGMAWRAIEMQSPFVVSNYDRWSDHTSVLANKAIGASLSVPLFGHRGPFGAINVAKHDGAGEFTEDDVHLVELFAQAAATALGVAGARQKSEELVLRQEQARLAGELHDGIAQDLAALLLRADLCQQAIGPANVPASAQLEAISRGLQKAIRDARATIWALRNPERGDCLLEESLRAQIVQFEAQSGIPVQYSIEGEACERLSNVRELVLLRAAQEALHNIHKHAQATQVIICLTWNTEQGQVAVSISDEGDGFLPEPAQQPEDGSNHSVGLLIMRERVEALGGWVSVDSEVGRGTTVRIVLPFGDEMGDIRHA